MTEPIHRSDRKTAPIDTASLDWPVNEHGAALLMLSADPVSGAISFLLRTPLGLEYPERAHFYDCDEDVFQVAGEYHHDIELPLRPGDYVYRPPGAVYGNSQGTEGGVTFVALARQPRRFHFESNPEPWAGEYLVDAAWNPRAEGRLHVPSASLPWQALPHGVQLKALRGTPGGSDPRYGARPHSPWGADAALLLRFPAGYRGPANPWEGPIDELLVLSGTCRLGGVTLERLGYAFDSRGLELVAETPVELFVRQFAP